MDTSKAVEQIYNAVIQERTSLVIFFCSQHYSLKELSALLSSKFADIEVVGCTSSGCIGTSGYQAKGIVACSFSAEVFDFSVALIRNIQNFSYHQADEIVSALKSEIEIFSDNEPKVHNLFALQLIDGLCLKEEIFTQILCTALNGAPLLGGSAGDDLKFEHTYVYHKGEFYPSAALVMLGKTTLSFVPFMIQHFLPTEKRLVVTESIPEQRLVKTLNGLPAALEYARNVGCEADELTADIFASHPVLVKIGDEVYVRSIQQMNDDGSLTFFCAIDDGVVLSVAEAEEIVQNLDKELAQITAGLGEPGLILGFDCIFRYLELEQRDQVGLVSEIFNKHNVIGFNSYGEQFSAMHVNQTFTGIAFSKEVADSDVWTSSIVI
ncbi:MAG: FIST N-terminal domain-containing protein [Neptuniibacter sp.]